MLEVILLCKGNEIDVSVETLILYKNIHLEDFCYYRTYFMLHFSQKKFIWIYNEKK